MKLRADLYGELYEVDAVEFELVSLNCGYNANSHLCHRHARSFCH